jgi:hypothetical protein
MTFSNFASRRHIRASFFGFRPFLQNISTHLNRGRDHLVLKAALVKSRLSTFRVSFRLRRRISLLAGPRQRLCAAAQMRIDPVRLTSTTSEKFLNALDHARLMEPRERVDGFAVPHVKRCESRPSREALARSMDLGVSGACREHIRAPPSARKLSAIAAPMPRGSAGDENLAPLKETGV